MQANSPQTVRASRRRFLTSLSAVLLAAWGFGSARAVEPAGRTVRLLTVGNSFSQNATHYLGALAKADGNTLVLHKCDIGGATLEQHWRKTEQHEANATDAQGFYSTKKSLAEELAAEPWDAVTIQQASIRSHEVASYQPFASKLAAYIRERAPRTELFLHETWAYRMDDPRFKGAAAAPGEPASREAMYAALNAAYKTVASELSVRRLPVGDAFDLVDTDPRWGYKPESGFDFKAAQSPALPDQTHSLHVGWRWMAGTTEGSLKMVMDGHHAGLAGEYLGGCVWYEVLFGKSPVGNTFVPPGLDPEFARFLQQSAHTAVEREAQRSR